MRPSHLLQRSARAAALSGVAVLAGALVAACSSSASAASTTLTYKTVEASFSAIPIAGQTSQQPQPGDYVVITDNYLQDGKIVGTDNVHCVLITAASSLCYIGVKLPKGELTLQGIGPAGGTGDFYVAITGGTGDYKSARGEAHFSSGKGNTGTETFTLDS